MMWGVIHLFCSICGVMIEYNGNKPTMTYQHHRFGICCSKACWERAEMKYARMILGKDD